MSNKLQMWPIAIILFFALAITSIVFFVRFTLGHRMDLVYEDYYQQELHYQDQIDALKRAANLPEKPTWTLERNTLRLQVLLPAPVAGSASDVQAVFYRPSDKRMDRTVKLQAGKSEHAIDVSSFPAGRWTFKLSWIMDDEAYRMEAPLVLPGVMP